MVLVGVLWPYCEDMRFPHGKKRGVKVEQYPQVTLELYSLGFQSSMYFRCCSEQQQEAADSSMKACVCAITDDGDLSILPWCNKGPHKMLHERLM